jgi:hypothetical protein
MLTETQRSVITRALQVAAERYVEDARLVRGEQSRTLHGPASAERLGAQFDKQAGDAAIMADLIEDAFSVEVLP